jgi:prepilin-type N-terminal cleavage/methylation domain-containing protein
MRTAFKYCDKGFTLIEVLIALFLFALVFTGLINSSLLVMNTNLENLLRDEAASVADQQMAVLRSTPFNSIPAIVTIITDTRNVRGWTNVPFTITQTVNQLDANDKSVTIQVSWSKNGRTRLQTYATLLRYRP